MELLLRVLVWAVEAGIEAFRVARAKRELRARGIDPTTVEIAPGESADDVHQRIKARLEGDLAALQGLAVRAQTAVDDAVGLERDLDAIPGGRLLRVVTQESVRPELERGIPWIRALLAELGALSVPQAVARIDGDPQVGGQFRALHLATLRVTVLTALRDTRARPEAAYGLADADAIASTFLAPIHEFAVTHGVALPAALPICVPAAPGREAIWFGLLPDHPLLFVPANFHQDLYRYASVPHELGHLLWRDLPGLADDVARAAGFRPDTRMLVAHEGRIAGTIDQLYTPWLPEIWADYTAVLQLGPSGLRGLVRSFACPDTPRLVVIAHASADGYDEHPPAHVRVHLAARVLWGMGFDQEAQIILEEWDTLHNNPEDIFVPLEDGSHVKVRAAMILERGFEAIDRLYAAQFDSLGGFRLCDIPGVEMSPGLWARAMKRSEHLLADTPFNDEGRIVLAAAIHARTLRPDLAEVIATGLRRAILGRDAGEHRVADREYREHRRHRDAGSFVSDVRAALVLGEVLARPVRRRAR